MRQFTTLLIGTFLLAASAQAQLMYKWVDEQGNVTYQDIPPPGQAEDATPYAEDPELAAEEATPAVPDVPVTLYSVPVCDACDLVRNLLENNDVPFDEKDASKDAGTQRELLDVSGQLSVPALVVGETVLNGYNSSGITAELTNAGFTLGGRPRADGRSTAPGSSLSAEEVAEQAAQAAAELTADLEELTGDAGLIDEVVEEIPEEEQIKISIGQ